MQRRRPHLPLAAVAFALTWTASGALAQTPPGDAAREAESLAATGLAARRAGQDAAALTAFERAYALAPRVSVQAQIGFALQALGRWVEAERALDAVSQSQDAWVQRHRATVDASLAAVRGHLGWLVIDVEPAGSEVRVEGASIAAGSPVRRPVGSVTVSAAHADHYPAERAVEIRAGETTRESIVLRLRAPEPAAAPIVPAPVAPVAPPPVVHVDVITAPPLRWVGPVVLAGAGVATLGLGAGLWFARNVALDGVTAGGCVETPAEFVCDARTANVAAARSAHDDAASLSTASVVSFAVGSALLAAGAGWLLVEALGRPRHGRAVSFEPGGVRWSF